MAKKWSNPNYQPPNKNHITIGNPVLDERLTEQEHYRQKNNNRTSSTGNNEQSYIRRHYLTPKYTNDKKK